MSAFAADNWMPILSRLNSILLRSEYWKGYIAQEALAMGWCGLSPATESEICETERQLGVAFPPSYRSFFAAANGWRPFSGFIERLFSMREIERFQSADPEDLELIQRYFQEDDLSDEEYLDYQTPRRVEALRHRYYPKSILVGKGWDGGGGELILLNSHIVSPDGEWEAIFFANWIPGNRRFRSFRDLVEDSIDTTERFEATRSP